MKSEIKLDFSKLSKNTDKEKKVKVLKNNVLNDNKK